MIFDTKNSVGKKIEVLDACGRVIPMVKSYNTETREAEIIIRAKDYYNKGKRLTQMAIIDLSDLHGIQTEEESKREILTAKVKMPGSRIVVDGITY